MDPFERLRATNALTLERARELETHAEVRRLMRAAVAEAAAVLGPVALDALRGAVAALAERAADELSEAL